MIILTMNYCTHEESARLARVVLTLQPPKDYAGNSAFGIFLRKFILPDDANKGEINQDGQYKCQFL